MSSFVTIVEHVCRETSPGLTLRQAAADLTHDPVYAWAIYDQGRYWLRILRERGSADVEIAPKHDPHAWVLLERLVAALRSEEAARELDAARDRIVSFEQDLTLQWPHLVGLLPDLTRICGRWTWRRYRGLRTAP